MNHSILLALTLLIFTTPALSWVISADFEKAGVGDVAELPTEDVFHRTADNSRVVSSPVFSGKQAGSVIAHKGATGFGKWGGAFYFPSKLKEGDSLWWRVNVFYPAGWDFGCGGCTEGMKFMRIHVANSSGKNVGYLHTFIKGGTTDGNIIASSEVGGSAFGDNNFDSGNYSRFNLGKTIKRDTWVTFEFQVKLSKGKGEYRLWQDGNLIFEDLETKTLGSSSDVSDFVYFYTYWNNGAPRTQTSYVDDIIVTNERPSKVDANGNPFIGVGNYDYVYVADPKAASQLEAQ